MNIGIFGGTFDPVHHGHLILAERCRADAGLDEVWFLPSYKPPHKVGRPITRFEHRCDMIALATTGQPLFRVEAIEKELPPPSFTANTLAELRVRHPEHAFHLIVGADCLPDLAQWHEPRRVLEQASLVVVPRPGTPLWTREQLAASLGMPPADVRLTVVECPLMEISSRDIRTRVAAAQTIRFLLPRSVEEFIRERKLYAHE
ncbi:nicotinate-nucleotide adenylyltransferase [Limnoglobus roseus]|uniref:Probable nicotinate-nucleotide adenylyltransferase n=1 Tax=Limnoglobus roseus TaxID=2598579 RepID=A0A5C1A7Z6_9BACT|nr:nicotinate-nucleotide adenylyltransferase [Limnoglobus roseus]QEL15321.1 nicotinate (nicotinamide) nucleotide adenylyltransferase [Limnoglobus roseus]